MEIEERIDLSHIAWECGMYFNNVGNFSIVPVGKENYLASFRVFGYYIDGKGRYLTDERMKLQHPDQHIFAILDRDFQFVKQLKLVENTYYKPKGYEDKRTYLEDMRLCKWGDEIYGASATFYTESGQWEKMGLEVQKISLLGDEEVQATHLWNSHEQGIEGRMKNFLPVPDKPFTYVTGTSSKGACLIDISTTTTTEVGDYDPDDLYRGNTPLLKWGDGYLTICHKLTKDEFGRKRYLNYFVEYSKHLVPTRISSPFKLCESNIEFITTLLKNGDEWWIGDTSNDDTPFLCRVNIHDNSYN